MGKAYESRVTAKFARKPKEGFLEVVVRLGRDVVVLQVLLPMEGDSLGLDLALLDINLVAAEDDGDVLADADEVTCVQVSGGCPHVLVGFVYPKVYIRCQFGTFL